MTRTLAPPPAELFERPAPPAGPDEIGLDIGGIRLRFVGLPRALRAAMALRFDRFLAAAGAADELRVECRDAQRDYFIEPPAEPERNPVQLACDGERVRFVGYRLAGILETRGARGALLLARGDYEPADRAVENYVRCAVAWRAAERGGALVHAASAVWRGRAYLFYGESGAGKSTLSASNRRATVISDDLSLVVRGEDGAPHVAGTPFRGTYEEGERVVGRFPLVAGFRLIQDRSASVQPVPRVRALSELVGNLPFLAEAFARRPDLFASVEVTFEGVPLRHLHFRPDDDYWDAIRDAGL